MTKRHLLNIRFMLLPSHTFTLNTVWTVWASSTRHCIRQDKCKVHRNFCTPNEIIYYTSSVICLSYCFVLYQLVLIMIFCALHLYHAHEYYLFRAWISGLDCCFFFYFCGHSVLFILSFDADIPSNFSVIVSSVTSSYNSSNETQQD